MADTAFPAGGARPPATNPGRHFAQAGFSVPAPIERVFPLFDPLNESRWVPGWRITPVQPQPFRVERNAVFQTQSDGATAVWTIVRFEPERHAVEYLVVVPEVLQRWVSVACTPEAGATRVHVSYAVTALGPRGQALLRRYDEAFIFGWREPVSRAAREWTDEEAARD